MIGNVGRADRAAKYRVELFEPVEPAAGNVMTVFFVVLAAPRKMLDAKLEAAVAFGQHFERLQARGDDFGADAVAGNGGNFVFAHFIGEVSKRRGKNRKAKGNGSLMVCHP